MYRRSLRAVASLAAPLLAVALLTACGGDDDASSADDDTSSSTPAGADGTGDGPTAEELTTLAAEADVAGYEAGDPSTGGLGDVVNRTYSGDGLQAYVTLAPCDPFRCWHLAREVDAEHEENLRSNLAPVHLDNPDLVFEYGTVEAAPGYEAFYTYSFSFVAEGTSKAATNSYQLVFHDEQKLITVQVQPEPGPLPDSAADFQAEMDRFRGESVAGEVFAAYADAFEPSA